MGVVRQAEAGRASFVNPSREREVMMQTGIGQVVMQLVAPILAGGMIGIERSYHGRPAGFRTHALVCASSSMLMLLSVHAPRLAATPLADTVRLDPTRMAQGIVTGIGFLGAGVIFKEGWTVRGLTTAASIWMTSAIGILMGAGLHLVATCATVATLGVLATFRRVEMLLPGNIYANHVLTFSRDRIIPEKEMRAMLEEHGFRIANVGYRTARDGKLFEYRMVIRTTDSSNLARLARSLASSDLVREFQLQQSAA
jgi:putative Mg2+ transporter-C (MgtC) family protein